MTIRLPLHYVPAHPETEPFTAVEVADQTMIGQWLDESWSI